MTEVELVNRFQGQPGVRACTKPIKINGPGGQLPLARRHGFTPSTLSMGLDLAKKLDYSVSKEGLTDA
jgi:hypothetical protein